ncbi:AraC family transcriptional regulator [Psychrobacillus vulpis]|uniref:AraC family transcriptional regulator n=1 Tax=Psychrobacillus vulpis TaxID=2325572 RepID=A0A544TVK5_9BACI|nr:AraC family transcriptional regulator [Psychrobacillus vulpis]TQR21487.1 AraC family transcriptional regulator [Psychrobacillus vulpis]
MQRTDKTFLEHFSKYYIKELNSMDLVGGLDQLYELENKLFLDMYAFEIENAKKTLREIIEKIITRAGKHMILAVKYYYIQLSAVMARKLYECQVPADKVSAFSVSSVEVIELKMSDAQFLQYADELVEFFVMVITERKKPSFGHQTVNKVILFINDQIETDLTVEDIAKHFRISTSHLSRIFREHTGVTLVEYLNIRKIEECQYFLRHTNKGIADISDSFHFCNQSYFTRIFKKYTGLTPKQFRDHQEYANFKYNFPKENKTI